MDRLSVLRTNIGLQENVIPVRGMFPIAKLIPSEVKEVLDQSTVVQNREWKLQRDKKNEIIKSGPGRGKTEGKKTIDKRILNISSDSWRDQVFFFIRNPPDENWIPSQIERFKNWNGSNLKT